MTQFARRSLNISIFFLFTLTISSCQNKQNEVYTYAVKYCNFIDQMSIVGELQPSTSINLSCPSLRADATISYLAAHGEWIEKGDTVCVLGAQEIVSKYDQAKIELENSEAEYRKSEAQSQLAIQLLVAQKETIEASEAIKRLDSIQQKFVSSSRKRIIELELKKAELEKEKIVNRLNSLKKINKSELSQKEIKIKQAENKVKSAKSLLNQLIITAPSSGVFLRAKLRRGTKLINTGDIVWRGMAIGKIPNSSNYQVKFSLSEQECKHIEKDFYFEANFDSGKIVRGKIKNKASVGMPIEDKSEVKIYEVIAIVDSLNFIPKPGQSLLCKVTTKNIPDAYVLPLLSIFQEDSVQVAYVAKKNKFEKRVLKIIYKNAIQVIVKDGFTDDEKVALIKPHTSLILNKDSSYE